MKPVIRTKAQILEVRTRLVELDKFIQDLGQVDVANHAEDLITKEVASLLRKHCMNFLTLDDVLELAVRVRHAYQEEITNFDEGRGV